LGEEPSFRPGVGPGASGVPEAVSRLLHELAQAPDEDLAASWREALRPDDVVGRFQIRGEIGRGGFGAVYEAFDPDLGRSVALKTLRPGRTRRELSEEGIRREAEAVARLDHPAIVTIFDVGTCPAGAYLVMELLHGETLESRIAKGPLPVEEGLRIGEEMAQGLAHAHSRGVLHRDLKPANVFLTGDGRVKLLDFGLAYLLGTPGSSGAGTPAYMAPEQAGGGPVDERADVYAAGMVLGEMLTGKRPVDSSAPREVASRPGAPGTDRMRMPEVPSPPSPAPPTLPDLPGVPRPIARCVTAALSTDPATRPRDGAAWLAALRTARGKLERPRKARHVAVLAGIGLVLGLAVAGLATWRVWERQIPGGRPTVAVADFANETGEKELDSISGLLITSLEQSTQLRVLTRGRMLDVLRQMGKGSVERIDEPLAREVGRETRARALLLASIRKLGDIYVVEMRALDPLHDEYLFTVSDRAAGKAAVFDLVDRLGEATRKRLRTGPETTPQRQVASITTPNLKAWELLFRARQSFDRTRIAEASQLAEAALREDPDFALAHYQLAVFESWNERMSESGQRHLEIAETLADRLPEKERLALRAVRALDAKRWEESRRLRDQAAEAFPGDKEAQFYAGDIRFHRNEPGESIPFFERALQLDPDYRLAAAHLADALDNSGRARERVPWLRQQAATAREPFELEALARALLAAGDEDGAVGLFRRAADAAGGPWPPLALAQYRVFVGRALEVEATAREALAACPPDAETSQPERFWVAKKSLATALLAQGRLADWRALAAEIDPGRESIAIQRVRAAAAGRDAGALRAAIAELETIAPGRSWKVTSVVAQAGYVQLAGPLASKALALQDPEEQQPLSRRLFEAVLQWSAGSTDVAARQLHTIANDAPPGGSYLSLVLLGQLHLGAGDCASAITALERGRALRWTWSSTAHHAEHPGLLHALALCYERTGDLTKARERNEEMLRLWARADSDLPLLVEAKAMRTRLAAATPAWR
jgi:serine/threonine protein kinase/tetratricopeptide (TPR) repeat protein